MYVQYKKKDIYPGPGGQGGSYVSTLLELDPTQLSRYQQVKKNLPLQIHGTNKNKNSISHSIFLPSFPTF